MARKRVRRTMLAVLANAGEGIEVYRTVGVCWTYRADDPYALVLEIDTARGMVRWHLGRELLADGLHARAGEGDVRVWPDDGTPDTPGRVWLELASPSGRARLSFHREDLAELVAATGELVAVGGEWAHIDWGREMVLLAGPVFTGLTALQADGLACVWCGQSYVHDGGPHRPVGTTTGGGQVFACVGLCHELASATAAGEGRDAA